VSGPVLVGHVLWQGPPAQPSAQQQLPITLTLRIGSTEIDYGTQNTDPTGHFTVSVGSLVSGTYSWRVKGSKSLANAGSLALTGAPVTNIDMGLMLTGDANNDNVVSSVDFNILRLTMNKTLGDPGYDARADFNEDRVISIVDFNLLKGNYNRGGAPPIGPLP
jgi:Dockerin type I domain